MQSSGFGTILTCQSNRTNPRNGNQCRRTTPSILTYGVSATGKQYLVIAAGGHPKITEEKLGDSLSAFALP
jgi:glucose dehydrogenase